MSIFVETIKVETRCVAPNMPPCFGQGGSSDPVLSWNKREDMVDDLMRHTADDINTFHCFVDWFGVWGRIGAVSSDDAATVSVSCLVHHL